MLSFANFSLIDIARVLIIIMTFIHVSRLDMESRIVPHQTWVLPTILGILLINIELAFKTNVEFIYYVHLGLIALTLPPIGIAAHNLYESKKPHTYTWALPVLTTLGFIALQLVFAYTSPGFTQPQYTDLLTTVFANIIFATFIGFILFAFPAIGMGGADFMAFIVIGILLPTRPDLGGLPLVTPPTIPFPASLITLEIITIIVNTGFLLLLYLPLLPIKNYLTGNTGNPFLTAFTKEIPIENLHKNHGRIIPTWQLENEASLYNRIKLYLSPNGLDTFFLSEYFEWRQHVAEQTPNSLKDEHKIYLKQFLNAHRDYFDYDSNEGWDTDTFEEDEQFLQNLVQQDTVRLMPGLPFLVPLFGGILLALTIGDLMLFVLTYINAII